MQFQDHSMLIHFILDGDDLTASTGSIINLLSELMHYGKDELIFAVVGSDASQILPSLLPLMLHSLRTDFKFMLSSLIGQHQRHLVDSILKTDIRSVREAAIESISSILECTGTNNLNIVLQDTLNRAFYMSLIESPSSKMSTAAQSTWCHAIQRAPTDLLHEICKANLSLWILLASSPDNIPMDSSLVSMLREKSPTDELFWMGSASPQDKGWIQTSFPRIEKNDFFILNSISV